MAARDANDQRAFRLKRSQRRPSEEEFMPNALDLDAQWAWEGFGGRSLEQAYEVFAGNPCGCTEDFQAMGRRAFDYYFPVLDRYLREVVGTDEFDEDELAWYGRVIAEQLSLGRVTATLKDEVAGLVAFVFEHAGAGASERGLRRIEREWRAVDAIVNGGDASGV